MKVSAPYDSDRFVWNARTVLCCSFAIHCILSRSSYIHANGDSNSYISRLNPYKGTLVPYIDKSVQYIIYDLYIVEMNVFISGPYCVSLVLSNSSVLQIVFLVLK